MTWARAMRRELGRAVHLLIGAAIFLAGLLIGASWEHATVLEQQALIDHWAAQHWVFKYHPGR